MHTYMIQNANLPTNGSNGGYNTDAPVVSGYFLPLTDATTGGIKMDNDLAGHRLSLGEGPFMYELTSGTYGFGYGSKGSSIQLSNTYWGRADDPAQAPWFEMDETIKFYDGPNGTPYQNYRG